VSPDGRTLLVLDPGESEGDAAVVALDAATGARLWRDEGRESRQVRTLAALPGGKQFAIGCLDGTVAFADLATGKVTPRPDRHGCYVAVGLEPNGRALTAGQDARIRRWDAASGRELGSVAVEGVDKFTAVAFSPDRRAVVGTAQAGKKTVAVIADTATGKTTALRWNEDNAEFWDTSALNTPVLEGGRPATWLPDGSVVVANWHRAARFGRDGKEVRVYEAVEILEGSGAYSVAASPDGKRVALAGYGSNQSGWVAVFEAESGKLVRAGTTKDELYGAAFLADGTVVVTGRVYPPGRTAEAVAVFDPATGKFRHPFADPTNGKETRKPLVPTVSPDGTAVAVAEDDYAVTVYDAKSGAVRRRLRGHANQVFQLAFTPDGSRLVSVSWDGTGLVWDLSPPRR
jgi:WD40 repeat protein